ncbi:nucleotidyltransferase family protein [Roseivirga sp. UBA1976]|uniref:nucleotidyltransferase family protein n=1 Tax=Roseivirga sp. UBA1976 TaxID=1947386 RepID=UPI00257F33FF|nr:nucleotidyltransferase family protein [Roseivirga sp. UBA1976]|tara:strand:- start:8938 stop:9525 length:588 start_codon:yes stop_codon:yes gene_type:complete
MKIGAVLLAAGLSTRMQGPNKMLLPFGHTTILTATLTHLLDSEVNKIALVLGRNASEFQVDSNEKVDLVVNPQPERGMTSSIQCGLRKLMSMDALMVCLADMPLLSSSDYTGLIQSFRNTQKTILVPIYKGAKGNPVVFDKRHFHEILNHKGANGCSGVVQHNLNAVERLEVSSDRFIADIDTPIDYQKMLKAIE